MATSEVGKKDSVSGGKNAALWTLQGLLAAVFLLAGTMKLVTPLAELSAQTKLPGGFLLFIGVAEIAGALGLVLPWALKVKPELTPLAASGLAMIMCGATVLSIAQGKYGVAPISFAFGLLCVVLMRGRFAGL